MKLNEKSNKITNQELDWVLDKKSLYLPTKKYHRRIANWLHGDRKEKEKKKDFIARSFMNFLDSHPGLFDQEY